MNKTSLLVFFAAAALRGVTAHAQTTTTLIDPTTNNGSFETPAAGKIDFAGATNASAVIPYWATTTGVAATDSGVDAGADITQQGARGAFQQPNTAIFNLVTSRPIVSGDIYTLTLYARNTNGGTLGASTDTLAVTLFSQVATDPSTPYTLDANGLLATTSVGVTNQLAFTQITLSYTAQDADAGNDIGVQISNGGPNYDGVDNVTLTVTTPAPEPSAYALMFAGIGGLLFVLRARHSMTA